MKLICDQDRYFILVDQSWIS